MVRANHSYSKVSFFLGGWGGWGVVVVWKSVMRACLHCRSYLWNWAILNGGLWLKEAREEVIKAETTDKLIGYQVYHWRRKTHICHLSSPLNRWAVNLYSCIFFSWEGFCISKVILDRMGAKKKKIPKHAVPSCNTDFPIQISNWGCYFGVCSIPPPLIASPCLSYWGVWSKDSQGAKYILIRTLEAAINEIQLSQTVAITGSDSFI